MKGHIVKRGKSWCLIFDLDRDAQGKRRQKWVTIQGGTRREAEKELVRIQNELLTGTYVEPVDMTVRQYLEYWLDNYAKVKVAPTTFDGYSCYILKHLIPALGRHKLANLTPAHIQAYYAQAELRGKRVGKGGLSRQTVRHIHRVLHQALHQAVRWEMLSKNPADAVIPPTPDHVEQNVIDADAIVRLVEQVEGKRLYLPILLAVTTGMRRGEILGARFADINWSNNVLSVQQTLVQPRSGMYFKQPKSKKSRRAIALPLVLVHALRLHKDRVEAKKRLLGAAYQDHDLLVSEEDGTPRSPRALSKAFEYLLEKNNLPHLRFHDLRHSHATLLLEQGVHIKVVSERLGHSSVNLTLDTYSHVSPNMQEEAARQVSKALNDALDRRKTRENKSTSEPSEEEN